MTDNQGEKKRDRVWLLLTIAATITTFAYYSSIFKIQQDMASDDFVRHLFSAAIPYIFGHLDVESLPDRFGSLVYMFLVFPSSSIIVILPALLLKSIGVTVLTAYFVTRVWLLLLTTLGAIPIFYLARKNSLSPFVSFMLTVVFLLNPVLFLFPDHYETGYNFLFFLLFCACLTQKRFRLGLVALVLAVLSHPSTLLLASGLVFVTMWKTERIWCRRYLLVCAGGFGYYILAFIALRLVGEGEWDILEHTVQLCALLNLLSGKGGSLDLLLIAIFLPLFQGFLLLLTMGFLPVLAGKRLLGMLPSFLYMVIRDGGIFRGSLPADIGALAFLSVEALARLPRVQQTMASMVCAVFALSSSLLVADFMLSKPEEKPLMQTYGIPYVTSKGNETLMGVREMVREQRLKRVMVSIDLVPYFVDTHAKVSVLGLDDPAMLFDLVVISDRAEDMSEMICEGMPPLRWKGLSADRVASDRQALLSSGRYMVQTRKGGLVVLVPVGRARSEG